VPLRPLIVVLALAVAVAVALAWAPGTAGAHGGMPGAGAHGGAQHAGEAVGTLVLLGVPALALAAAALLLRRAVRR
jgi:hypothetical protein